MGVPLFQAVGEAWLPSRTSLQRSRSKIMQRASEKRQLEALVIAKGASACGASPQPCHAPIPSFLPRLRPADPHLPSPSPAPATGKFKGPIGGSNARAGEAWQTIAEMAAQVRHEDNAAQAPADQPEYQHGLRLSDAV
jgi:hypothetical protein